MLVAETGILLLEKVVLQVPPVMGEVKVDYCPVVVADHFQTGTAYFVSIFMEAVMQVFPLVAPEGVMKVVWLENCL
jgi:hypothetical protein